MAKKQTKTQQQRSLFMSAARAHDHALRAQKMGNEAARQRFEALFEQRRAEWRATL